MSWFVGAVVLGLLIAIHELGHLLAAKSIGVPAEAFSIGFGPALWRRRWGGTEYRVSAVPLGGYVLIDPEGEAFRSSSAWARIWFFLAGPLVNVIAAAALFAAIGRLELFPKVIVEIGRVLEGLFTGSIPVGDLAGPVGIVQMAGRSAAEGPAAMLGFAAFLSLNLAILNLLPLPILDGGQIIIAAIEGILRRPLNLRVRVALAAVTWILMLGLFAYVTMGDISRLWSPKLPVA